MPRSFGPQLLWQYATWLRGYLWCSQNSQLPFGPQLLSTRNFLKLSLQERYENAQYFSSKRWWCCGTIFHDWSLPLFPALHLPLSRYSGLPLHSSTYLSTASHRHLVFNTARNLTELLNNLYNSRWFWETRKPSQLLTCNLCVSRHLEHEKQTLALQNKHEVPIQPGRTERCLKSAFIPAFSPFTHQHCHFCFLVAVFSFLLSLHTEDTFSWPCGIMAC